MINLIGLEIEGEFSPHMETLLRNNGQFVTDGSIHGCENDACDARSNMREFRATPKSKVSDFKDTFDLMQKGWEERTSERFFHANRSCGMHVHVSFKSENGGKTPVEIWSKQFHDLFFPELFKKFKNDKILQARKGNSYCIDWENRGVGDILASTSHYKALNYKGALDKHGTVEFRIFPSNEPKIMYKYLMFTINTIREFIAHSDKYLKEDFEVPFEPRVLEQSFHEVVDTRINRRRIHENARSAKQILLDKNKVQQEGSRRPIPMQNTWQQTYMYTGIDWGIGVTTTTGGNTLNPGITVSRLPDGRIVPTEEYARLMQDGRQREILADTVSGPQWREVNPRRRVPPQNPVLVTDEAGDIPF